MSPVAPFSPLSLSPLPLRPEPGAKVDDARRLADTARELEATFLSMLLKEMRQTLDEDGGLFPGDTGDVQGGLFDLYMSKHLADAGGVGMAAALERQLQHTYAPGRTTPDDPVARTAGG